MNIGQRIKQLRKQRGWSQVDLANAMGDRGHTSISLIETGQRTNFTIETLEGIASALGVTVARLITGNEPKVDALPKSEMEIIGDK